MKKANRSSKREKKSVSPQVSKVRVSLGKRSHFVYIGSNGIENLGDSIIRHPSKRAFIISDIQLTIPRQKLRSSLEQKGWEVHEIPVQAGEELKDFHKIYSIYGELIKKRANRDSLLFALGGGTIGDAGGFIAATYLRGISWVGVPTTLLAQVDSSVGGKTGINHPDGKNLIGSFHQPLAVICDTDFLNTLDHRDMISGLGEILKYGFIFDPKFLKYVKDHWNFILNRDAKVIAESVKKSLHWKSKVVAKDEHDRSGIREVLNFGHTFAHALESITNYEVFRHGEAVIWGMRFALALSAVRKKLNSRKQKMWNDFLRNIDVPQLPSHLSPRELFEFMKQDKKVRNGKIHFVLLKDLAKVVSDRDVEERDLHQAFDLMMEGSSSSSVNLELGNGE